MTTTVLTIDAASAARLRGVLPELAAAEAKLRAAAAARGIVYHIASEGGVRSEADTARIMAYRDADYAVYVRAMKAAGKTPLDKYTWRPIAAYGSSYHNFGSAFDVEMVKGTFAQLGALAPSVGLRWGGDAGFIAAKRRDDPHFQLPVTLLVAKAKWLAAGNVPGVARVFSTSVQVAAIMAVALIGGLAIKYGHGWKA